MLTPNQDKIEQTRQALARLQTMSLPELRLEHMRLFGGESTRSKCRRHLVRKLGWRVQELAESGLSEQAKARIHELQRTAPARRAYRPTERPPALVPEYLTPQGPLPSAPRDPRLPKPGTTLQKEHKGAVHVVRILPDGFEYCGERFGSLSKVATRICGGNRNGFRFFAEELRAAGGAA